MQIYVAKNNEKTGPFTIEQITANIQAGLFKTDDLCWHEDIPNWMPISSLFAPTQSEPALPPPLDTEQKIDQFVSGGKSGGKKWGVGELVAFYILTLLIPLAGLLLGILGIVSSNPKKKKQGGVLFGVSVFLIIFYIVIFSGK